MLSTGPTSIFIPEEFTFDIADELDSAEDDVLGDGDPSSDPVEGFARLLFRDLDPQNGEGRFFLSLIHI